MSNEAKLDFRPIGILKSDECQLDFEPKDEHYQEIPAVVKQLVGTCQSKDCFEHVSTMPLPSRHEVLSLIHQTRDLIFPGYFNDSGVDSVNLEYTLGQQVSKLYRELSAQITNAIRHDCFRYEQDCSHCVDNGRELGLSFIKSLPKLRASWPWMCGRPMRAIRPAASLDEIIFSYPGLFAITVHRMAHVLYHLEVPLLPRMMSEHAHSLTGIDIHPGAHMGDKSFFIDHGTGVVIGQTTKIGDRVRIYQGVTLGALSFRPMPG
jgi:serine O-acetyltransferase